MWASGLIGTSPSRLPAGTTSRAPFICRPGSADPQIEQKHLLCRVDGRVNCVTLSRPDSHFNAAVLVNRFAACADPVSFRQYLQWHR